jgi:hypothetical protein
LQLFSRHYVGRIREGLPHRTGSVRRIELEYSNGNATEIDEPSELNTLLKAARSISGEVYEVTEPGRRPIRLTITLSGGTTRTFFLLVPESGVGLRTEFARLIHRYMLRDAGYRSDYGPPRPSLRRYNLGRGVGGDQRVT